MPTFVDLCCGCGGFSRGMVDAGFELVAGFDTDRNAIRSFSRTFPARGIVADIRHMSLPPGAADAVVAGLPCQGYSTLGKREEGDLRNGLWEHYLRLILEADVSVGSVENVPLFLDSSEYHLLREGLEGEGYAVAEGVISALQFGVAQKRRRGFAVFARDGVPRLPLGNSVVRTVRDALDGLPHAPDGTNDHEPRHHGERTLERFKHVPEGGTRADLPDDLLSPCWRRTKNGATNSFGRLSWDQPADTLRTVFLKPETGRFIHPSEDRGLTVREGARLQGFSDEHQFVGSMEDRAAQIGNAVPPPVARAVGAELLRLVTSAQDRVLVKPA